MKKIFVLLITFAFLLTALVVDSSAQTGKKKKKHRGLATNIAIVGGNTAAGALIGRGTNGSMVGAGAGLLYASSRKGTKRRYAASNKRRVAKVAGGSLLGAGTGAVLSAAKPECSSAVRRVRAQHIFIRATAENITKRKTAETFMSETAKESIYKSFSST